MQLPLQPSPNVNTSTKPIPPPDHEEYPFPKLNLRIEDLDHPAVQLFLRLVGPDVKTSLKDGCVASFRWLYGEKSRYPTYVHQILLVLRAFSGVAHTFGVEPHPKHQKEIHFSLDHIRNTYDKFNGTIQEKETRTRSEILGVLTHEIVHCYQYNAKGTCPGGLIEGIADFVRLHSQLSPPHWKPHTDCDWNAGYERTAFFLDWVDRKYPVAGSQPKSHPMYGSPPPYPGYNPNNSTGAEPTSYAAYHASRGYAPVYLTPEPVNAYVKWERASSVSTSASSANAASVAMPVPSHLPEGAYDMRPTNPSQTQRVGLGAGWSKGTIVKLNGLMRERKYDEEKIWKECTGKTVKELWKEYCKEVEREGKK